MNAVTQITLEYRQAGMKFVRKGKHLVWDCPCGHARLQTSGTHNEGRGDNNARALLRRTLRTCRQRMKSGQ